MEGKSGKCQDISRTCLISCNVLEVRGAKDYEEGDVLGTQFDYQCILTAVLNLFGSSSPAIIKK